MSIIKFETIENKLIKYKHQFVIEDSHITQFYGAETREVNQALVEKMITILEKFKG